MMTRRELLSASAAGIALPVLSRAASAMTTSGVQNERAIRIAHLTDPHVQPERGAGEGLAACLAHAQGLRDRPDLIFTGGDMIMDAMAATKERSQVQWEVFGRVMREHLRLPVEHVIGNHDVFGWGKGETYASEPGYGKKWACDELGLAHPYRSFDRAGWHFIVLDSTFRKDNGYTARLDDEQFEWLVGDLQATPAATPIVVFSHIPILGAAPFFDGDNEKTGNWVVPGAWMHIDARRIKNLFLKHRNVKLCVSGHIHLVDHVRYNGVAYYCGGAVSAGWWGGDYQECTYGYSVIDLFADGSFQADYVPFGWETRK
jgi:3',5'-cyclic-AMP phosphodiesterase